MWPKNKMLKINISSLQKKINQYVADYYQLKNAPPLKEIPKEKYWIQGMIYPYVEYAIINRELNGVNRITVSERTADIEEGLKKCVTKKGYEVEKKLGEFSSKYLLKDGNKAAKIQMITMWEYKQRDELRSMINNQFKICKKAETLGIGPKTYDSFICYNESEKRAYRVIITEFIKGMSLEDWLKEDRSDKAREVVHNMVKKKIEKMHANGIIHNGLQWSQNIILKMKGNKVLDVYITDYVNAYDVQDKSMWEYNKWIQQDRYVLTSIKNKVRSYGNVDDVVNYVLHKLIDQKNIIIN